MIAIVEEKVPLGRLVWFW